MILKILYKEYIYLSICCDLFYVVIGEFVYLGFSQKVIKNSYFYIFFSFGLDRMDNIQKLY